MPYQARAPAQKPRSQSSHKLRHKSNHQHKSVCTCTPAKRPCTQTHAHIHTHTCVITWLPFSKLIGAKASTSITKSSFPQFLNRTLCCIAPRISLAISSGFGITCRVFVQTAQRACGSRHVMVKNPDRLSFRKSTPCTQSLIAQERSRAHVPRGCFPVCGVARLPLTHHVLVRLDLHDGRADCGSPPGRVSWCYSAVVSLWVVKQEGKVSYPYLLTCLARFLAAELFPERERCCV